MDGISRPTIKAIDTSYHGYLFRSRLEARWAVFFDAMGIEWKYEIEGFEFGNGIKYLPDFYTPKFGFVEIKPSYEQIKPGDWEKIYALNADTMLTLIIGSPWAAFNGYADGYEREYEVIQNPVFSTCPKAGYDLDSMRGIFVICRGCGETIGIEGLEYHFPREFPASIGGGYGICCTERISLGNHPRLISAYKAAMASRFEHSPACL